LIVAPPPMLAEVTVVRMFTPTAPAMPTVPPPPAIAIPTMSSFEDACTTRPPELPVAIWPPDISLL
jgi:hypothetical protein